MTDYMPDEPSSDPAPTAPRFLASDGQCFDRTPPQNLLAEQCVLGAMLLSKNAITDVAGNLKSSHFMRPAHQMIYDAVVDLYGRGGPVDPITVADALARRGELTQAGSAPYLHSLTSTVPTVASASYYADIVRDKAKDRRLAEAGQRIDILARSGEGDSEAHLAEAQEIIYQVGDEATKATVARFGDGLTETVDALEALASRTGEVNGVPTGLTELDHMTNGFQPGQLIVIAGRPAMGKSVLGTDIARSAALRQDMATVVFSLEMSRAEINRRIIAAEAGVTLNRLNRGDLREGDWDRVAKVLLDNAEKPLFIDDSASITIPEIRAKSLRLKQRHDLKLIVVDYLQLMTSGKKVESRQQEVSEFSRALKILAKDLEVPVIALSQLNRGPEQRQDKKPQLSDLRESGSIEQDSDVVILVNRPDVYDPDDRPGEADLIIAKHRNGPTDVVTTVFLGHYSRFADISRHQEPR